MPLRIQWFLFLVLEMHRPVTRLYNLYRRLSGGGADGRVTGVNGSINPLAVTGVNGSINSTSSGRRLRLLGRVSVFHTVSHSEIMRQNAVC